MKKWQGLMLVEHNELLRDWRESNNQVERPVLDDWELTLIQEEIDRAFKSDAGIKLTYWRDGYLKDDYGKIITLDNLGKSIVLDDPFTTTRYPFDDIVGVQIID